MFDYTPEGIKVYQNEAAINRLFSIDKSLKKINKKLRLIVVAGLAYVLYLNKDKIQNKIAKGE